MPTKRTRRGRKGALDQWCRNELLHGPCLLAGLGYWDDDSPDRRDWGRMRRDWETYGATLLAEWKAEHPEGTMPFAWWEFEAETRPDALYCELPRLRDDPDRFREIIEAEREYVARLEA